MLRKIAIALGAAGVIALVPADASARGGFGGGGFHGGGFGGGFHGTRLGALRFAGYREVGASTAGIAALNPENPHGYDGPDHGQSTNRPAGRVGRAVCFRSIDHRVVPVGHDSLPTDYLL
jgi:hypothetical protein